jgi:hypothetical protein
MQSLFYRHTSNISCRLRYALSPFLDLAIMKCRQCALPCHRICYNSKQNIQDFRCDHCIDHTSNHKTKLPPKECFMCGGLDDLMKRVGQLGYAHPMCLLENRDIRIKSYDLLVFEVGDFTLSEKSKVLCE